MIETSSGTAGEQLEGSGTAPPTYTPQPVPEAFQLPVWTREGWEGLARKAVKATVGPSSVYIIADRHHRPGDPVKIGFARQPRARLKALRNGSPHDLILFHAWAFADQDSAINFEEELHTWIEPWSVRGEWFSAPWRFIKLIGDTLLTGRKDRVALIFDHIEDADLCGFLGDRVGYDANLRGARELPGLNAADMPKVDYNPGVQVAVSPPKERPRKSPAQLSPDGA